MKQKRILSFVLAALLLFACAGVAAAEVVEIANAEQLAAFRDRVNSGETSLDAKLTADITLTGNWIPIGMQIVAGSDGSYSVSEDYSYNGRFDGNGMTVSGLRVTSADAASFFYDADFHDKAGGLFGVTSRDAEIKDLAIAGAEVLLSDVVSNVDSSAGAFVGYHFGSLANCTAQGGTLSGSYSAGGLTGYNGGTVANCTASGIDSILSGENAGGVVGYNDYGKVTACAAGGIASIRGDNRAGGIAGENYAGELTDCTASGIGSIGGFRAGGIAGYNTYVIKNCSAFDVEVTGVASAGGVAGYHDAFAGTLMANCAAVDVAVKADGDEYGSAQAQTGGIAGWNDAPIENCVVVNRTTGSRVQAVAADAYAGGISGFFSNNLSGLVLANCYYPRGIVDTDGIFSDPNEWAIGNVPEDDYDDDEHMSNVMSYDASDDADTLPAIMAMIADGMPLEVEAGKTLPVYITTLPGTLGAGQHDYTWSVASTDVATVSPDDEMTVTLTGAAIGQTTLTCAIRPIAGGTISADLVCAVNVVEAKPDPTPGGGSSSNCNSLGFGLPALAALPFVVRKKKQRK